MRVIFGGLTHADDLGLLHEDLDSEPSVQVIVATHLCEHPLLPQTAPCAADVTSADRLRHAGHLRPATVANCPTSASSASWNSWSEPSALQPSGNSQSMYTVSR